MSPDYYKDTSVSLGNNHIIIVKYRDRCASLSEDLYFFASGDEIIVCEKTGFFKYKKIGEVTIFKNYGVIP